MAQEKGVFINEEKEVLDQISPELKDAIESVVVNTVNNNTTELNTFTSGITTAPGGSDTHIQYNDGGVFGGDSNLTWNKTTGVLTFDGETQVANGSASFIILTPDTTASNALDIQLQTGDASGASTTPGDIILRPGINSGSATRQGVTQIRSDWQTGTNDSYVEIRNGTDGTSIKRKATRETTSNATPQDFALFTMPTNTTYWVSASVSARRTGGSAGSAGDSAGYQIYGLFKDISGTVSQVGSTTKPFVVEDQAGWDADFNINGSDVEIRFTGALNNSISWTFEVKYFEHVA